MTVVGGHEPWPIPRPGEDLEAFFSAVGDRPLYVVTPRSGYCPPELIEHAGFTRAGLLYRVRRAAPWPSAGATRPARSAGNGCQLLAKEGKYAVLRLPSGEMRRVPLECRATIGQVGNEDHGNISLGKAGRSRWLGRRPKVRGVVMNPVDHPHGGGEGRTSGGRHPVTPWGVPTKGHRTRKKNHRTDMYIIRRRKSKKS